MAAFAALYNAILIPADKPLIDAVSAIIPHLYSSLKSGMNILFKKQKYSKAKGFAIMRSLCAKLYGIMSLYK